MIIAADLQMPCIDTGEDTADAHMKRQVMGHGVVVAVTNGELDLSAWEQIFYGEFDGKRKKRVLTGLSLVLLSGAKNPYFQK